MPEMLASGAMSWSAKFPPLAPERGLIMRLFKLLLACLCLAGITAPASAQTAEERAQLAWVVERGRLIFDLDRAAWVGTDDLLERLPIAVTHLLDPIPMEIHVFTAPSSGPFPISEAQGNR